MDSVKVLLGLSVSPQTPNEFSYFKVFSVAATAVASLRASTLKDLIYEENQDHYFKTKLEGC